MEEGVGWLFRVKPTLNNHLQLELVLVKQFVSKLLHCCSPGTVSSVRLRLKLCCCNLTTAKKSHSNRITLYHDVGCVFVYNPTDLVHCAATFCCHYGCSSLHSLNWIHIKLWFRYTDTRRFDINTLKSVYKGL